MPINSFLYPGAKVTTAYEVANSCRFDNASNSSLSKTYSGDGNMKTWTVSMWIKRADLGRDQYFFGCGNGSSIGNYLQFNADDTLEVYSFSSSMQWQLITTAKYRDISAWYHVVVRMDNTQGTEADRLRIYVNGTQVTSFGTSSYPSQNTDYFINDATYPHYISLGDVGAYVAEVFFCDGQSLAASTFGEFDEDSPTIWKPKDCKADLTFGTNGFYLDFADSGDLGDDESGNTNDYTETNLAATDSATDTPTNNFATLNSLSTPATLSEGNLKGEHGGSGTYATASSTIGMTSGKWYCEAKLTTESSNYPATGICSTDSNEATKLDGADWLGRTSNSYGMYTDSGQVYNNGSVASTFSSASSGDIIGLALDLDSGTNTLKYYKNGTLIGTQNITTNSNGWFFAKTNQSSRVVEFNFGNPPYANSSDAADGNGYGAFEYAPPSGYLALCTKNLGSDGG